MEKIRYETDPFNRLVVSGRDTGLQRHRRVLDGVFKIGKGNSLEYRSKSPIQDGALSPYQLKFSGSWSLTKNHDLRFTLDAEKGSPASDSLKLSGEILAAKGDSLVFALTTRSGAIRKTYILELSGSWQADENNRLSFSVSRGQGSSDTMTFGAAWEVDKNNELIYRYERLSSSLRAKAKHAITFKGRWSVNDAAFLSYSLEGASNSQFDFRTALGICRVDRMEFELGIGLARHLRPVARTVVLYGTWKLSRSTGLKFEVECANGTIYSISFSAEARLTSGDRVSFSLKDPAGKKDLGLEMTLSHYILGRDGSAFIKLLKSREESAVFIGLAARW